MSDTPQSPELNPRDAELLSAYLDKMLSDAETRKLEARLQREPQLRNHLRYLRQTVTLLNNLPELKAPRDFTLTDDMLQRRRGSSGASGTPASPGRPDKSNRNGQSSPSQNGRSGSGWPLWGGLAAVLSVVLVGVLLLVNEGAPGSTGANQQIAQAPTRAATQAAEEAFAPVDDTDETGRTGDMPATVRDDDADRGVTAAAGGQMTATSLAMVAQPTSTPAPARPAGSAPPAAGDDDVTADEAVAVQSERSADSPPPESDTAAEAESVGSVSDGAPEPLTATPAGAEGARFSYTPTPFATPEPAAELQNQAAEIDPLSDADSADNLAEADSEAPSAAGGSAETGLAVPDAATVQPGINPQALQILRLVLDALRVLLSWSGCAIC